MSKQLPNPHFVEEVQQSFAKQLVMSLIGASLTRVEHGIIEITLPYRSDLTQQHGYVHAGIITTIADSACGYSAYTLMPPNSDVLAVESSGTITICEAKLATNPEIRREIVGQVLAYASGVAGCDIEAFDEAWSARSGGRSWRASPSAGR